MEIVGGRFWQKRASGANRLKQRVWIFFMVFVLASDGTNIVSRLELKEILVPCVILGMMEVKD